jgi:hypothetical protein
MKVENSLSEFISQIVSTKEQLAQNIGNYTSDDGAYNLSVFYYFENAQKTQIRYNSTKNQVEARIDFFKQSDLSVYFWLLWAFTRKDFQSNSEADIAVLSFVLQAFTSAKRSELADFYNEYNNIMSSNPTAANVKRSEDVFEIVSDRVVNLIEESAETKNV